jgi:hypothetical protein
MPSSAYSCVALPVHLRLLLLLNLRFTIVKFMCLCVCVCVCVCLGVGGWVFEGRVGVDDSTANRKAKYSVYSFRFLIWYSFEV